MRIFCAVLMMLAGMLPSFARQESMSVLGKSLQERYQGEIVTLRNFYAGRQLQFDADGNLQHTASIGPWTTCAKFEVKQVRLDRQTLIIQGRRLLLKYDPKAKNFVDIGLDPAVTRTPNEMLRRSLENNQELQLEVDVPSGGSRGDRLTTALARMFLADTEKLADVAPEYWRFFLERSSTIPSLTIEGVYAKMALGYRIYFPRELTALGLVLPREGQRSNPSFTDSARLARINGVVVVSAVIDPEGNVVKPQIIMPLGLGLEESAVAQLSRWKFEPASLNGQPVAVQTMLEFTFRLY